MDFHTNTFLGTYAHWSDKHLVLGAADRRSHCQVLGASGAGKTTFLHSQIVQDMHAGRGVAVIDPRGKLADLVAQSVPVERKQDVVFIDTADADQPVPINPLYGSAGMDDKERADCASNVLSVFRGIYGDSWGVELERVLLASLLALLDAPKARPTLLSVLRLIEDKRFRDEIVTQIENPASFIYFNKTVEAYRGNEFSQRANSTSNKVFQIAAHPTIANIVGQYQPTVSIPELMQARKIVIFSIPQRVLGQTFSELLCSLVASEFLLATRSISCHESPFFLYIDDFHRIRTDLFNSMLPECRDAGLFLTVAHQHLDQLPREMREAVTSNIENTVAFRLSADDARRFADRNQSLNASEYTELACGRAVASVNKGNIPQPAREIITAKVSVCSVKRGKTVRNLSRYRYGRSKQKITKSIRRTLGLIPPPKQPAAVPAKAVRKKHRKQVRTLVDRIYGAKKLQHKTK